MRRQYKRGAAVQQFHDAIQRPENFDIRVEIQDRWMPLGEQVPEHERLQRRVELHDIVSERELREIHDIQRMSWHHDAAGRIKRRIVDRHIGKAQI